WRLTTGSNAEHYGSAYLFVNYLSQRFGQETTQTVIEQPANGIQGITDGLQASGHALTFDDLFADWVIANYVEDPDALDRDGIYGYRNLDLTTPPTEELNKNDLLYQATVSNYATDYIELPSDGTTVHFQGQVQTRLTNTDPYSGRRAWWSHRGDDSNTRLTRKFDLRALTADSATPIEMDVAMWYNIEVDYDYGYVLASRDGKKWEMLEGAQMTRENPSGNSFGIAYTGESDGWITEQFDLSPYAGSEVWIRFEYVTDDAVNTSGWLIDDVEIPAIAYATDFEEEPTGWESEGWLLTDNLLTQHWLLQVMHFDGNELTAVERIPVGEDGFAELALSDTQTSIVAISAMTPISTEPASYELEIE
ncbi:MAG: immune inhibitor A, partial [Caldilineaceae bacterium]|nr:immune inhibitor A [Caldilineaceae bacterium]